MFSCFTPVHGALTHSACLLLCTLHQRPHLEAIFTTLGAPCTLACLLLCALQQRSCSVTLRLFLAVHLLRLQRRCLYGTIRRYTLRHVSNESWQSCSGGPTLRRGFYPYDYDGIRQKTYPSNKRSAHFSFAIQGSLTWIHCLIINTLARERGKEKYARLGQ